MIIIHMMVYGTIKEKETRFKHNLPYHAEAYAHQSDILNPADYRLNNEFVKDIILKRRDGDLSIYLHYWWY